MNSTGAKIAVAVIEVCKIYLPYMNTLKKVKVSHSLIAVGAVGVRVPLYLGHS